MKSTNELSSLFVGKAEMTGLEADVPIYKAETEFDVFICGICDIMWAMPVGFVVMRKDDHEWWHCPRGHMWRF